MQYSAEIRWFPDNNSTSLAILSWFNNQGRHFTGSNQREDYYLLVKNMPTHGIKIREGKLEIKVLHHDWGAILMANDNQGRANMWCRYGFTLGREDQENKEVIAAFAGIRSIGINRDWLRMDKERLMVTYGIDTGNGSIKIAGENEKPEQGCNVEFTRIKINLQKEYYTFGLEAFGKGVDVKRNLETAAGELFKTSRIEGLTTACSMSYPEFLEKL